MTAHRLHKADVKPGETLEAHGISPEDIILKKDISNSSVRLYEALRVWYIEEVELDD